MPSTLADWLSYLESLHPKTIALGLERVAQLKQRLNLRPGFPIIVVGGTNGKGSVCAMLESMLHAAGYRVGCYTSPHLLDYNERVRIAKKQASDAELCAAFEKIERARRQQLTDFKLESPPPCRGGAREGVEAQHPHRAYPHPNLPPARGKELSAESVEVLWTYVEFGTLAAMQCFIEHKVEVAILEVGLGGRLDAVNVFDNDCAVVTNVDIDHTDYLGDTREKIAYEKAGIFRAGRVAICADADVPQAITDHAEKIGAQLWRIGREFGFTTHQGQWDYRSAVGARNSMPYPALRGAFQLHNASAALAALDALREKLPVGMEAVRRGLVEIALPGRFQVVPGKPMPMLILDVAHNPHAARSLAQNLASLPPCPRTYAVFAMLKDKDMAGVARALKDQVDVWLVAGISAPRGATAAELAQVLHAEEVKGAILTFATATDALQHACNEATENDRIAAFGSFYTVAEVMRARGLRYG
ncbi:MAG: bifunctional folylpolyglutamate synthase/dihydrofolate synthase [Nitrosomonadales bacterium]|nr:bifunctional folylpolyglutamate synthase/dihydrofolate synthase [Nitrosomonadales bacterium]